MRATMRCRSTKGFTLLEVMLATSVMAVGTMSVLIVIATAAGMASKRQGDLRREQVVEEARHYAQTVVNAFRPGRIDPKAAKPVEKIGTRAGTSKAVTNVKITPDPVKARRSERYAGFDYDLDFKPKDPSVPEKGYDVAIVLHYGDEKSYDSFASLVSTSIADEEFGFSETYEQEQAGRASGDKPRETR